MPNDNNQVDTQENQPPQNASDVQQQAQQPNPQPQPPQQSGWQIFQSMVTRMLVFYLAMQAMNYFKTKPVNVTRDLGNDVGKSSFNDLYQPGNLFPKGTKFNMNVYIAETENFKNFSDRNHLFWSVNDIEYGDWSMGLTNDGQLVYDGQITLTEKMQNNGTIYLHVHFSESDSEFPKKNSKLNKREFSTFKRLNKYSKKMYKSTKNLLTGSTDKDEEYQQKAKEKVVEVLSFWHPNITINLIDDHTPWQKNQVPSPLNEYIEFDETGKYYPIVFLNDYWNLHSDYQPINSTLTYLNLSITFSHLQLWKWQLYLSQSMRNQWYGNMLAEDSTDEDQDTIKRTLLETNIYLLALTIVITLVHNVFEFLAFKNDIQFWRNRKSLEGLSVNSVLFSCFTSFIVLLYVLDNETNTVVRISVGIGLLIDLWKVPKVLTIKLNHENKYFGVIPRVEWIYKTSYVVSNTNDYDRLAFKYLSWVLFPLVVGYAIYSLIYTEHKGWYSWLLSMIYGFLLMFGFIMMTPQLFINYKLKSVAHLPWRMMTYKALNTFIDDIFAFVIKMPTLYRIGCFRDDIIFFIYLYQKWIYPVDKKRTNEFGTSGEDPTGATIQEDTDQTQSIQGAATTTTTSTTASSSGHAKSE